MPDKPNIPLTRPPGRDTGTTLTGAALVRDLDPQNLDGQIGIVVSPSLMGTGREGDPIRHTRIGKDIVRTNVTSANYDEEGHYIGPGEEDTSRPVPMLVVTLVGQNAEAAESTQNCVAPVDITGYTHLRWSIQNINTGTSLTFTPEYRIGGGSWNPLDTGIVPTPSNDICDVSAWVAIPGGAVDQDVYLRVYSGGLDGDVDISHATIQFKYAPV